MLPGASKAPLTKGTAQGAFSVRNGLRSIWPPAQTSATRNRLTDFDVLFAQRLGKLPMMALLRSLICGRAGPSRCSHDVTASRGLLFGSVLCHRPDGRLRMFLAGTGGNVGCCCTAPIAAATARIDARSLLIIWPPRNRQQDQPCPCPTGWRRCRACSDACAHPI